MEEMLMEPRSIPSPEELSSDEDEEQQWGQITT